MGCIATRRLIARPGGPDMITSTTMLEVALVTRESVAPFRSESG